MMSVRMIGLLLLPVLLASLCLVANAIFEAPTKGTTAFCYDLQCVADTLEMLVPYDPTIIAMMSYDFADDSYLGLYLGSLLELFDAPEMAFVAIVLQMPYGMDRVQSVIKFAQLLPPKTIFASVEHGRSMTGMRTMGMLKELGVAPPVIYHLNHEQPWQVDNSADPMNHIFDSVEALTSLYAQFPLVLRNYYYAPLVSTSYYLPVSAPFEGYVVQNSSSGVFLASQTSRASQRGHRCYFKGRIDYAKYSPEVSPHRLPELLESDEFYPQAIERREIIRLSKRNALGGCEAVSSDMSTQEVYDGGAAGRFQASYREYTSVLADTAFVLCPSGNSAETFRHTEAMEFGAIPIILKVDDPAHNYLNDLHWAGYPGPVLAGWAELESYLHAMTDAKIDALQQRVRSWYAEAKARKKRALVEKLKVAFQSVGISRVGRVGSTGASSGTRGGSGGSGGSATTASTAHSTMVGSVGGASGDVKRIINDLQFGEIPAGMYEYTTQSLLSMLMKQDARIKVLERTVELLLAERES